MHAVCIMLQRLCKLSLPLSRHALGTHTVNELVVHCTSLCRTGCADFVCLPGLTQVMYQVRATPFMSATAHIVCCQT